MSYYQNADGRDKSISPRPVVFSLRLSGTGVEIGVHQRGEGGHRRTRRMF